MGLTAQASAALAALDLYGVLASALEVCADEPDETMQAARDETGWGLINKLIELQGPGEGIHTVATIGVLLFCAGSVEDAPIEVLRDCIAYWRLLYENESELEQ
jgi:hypothetical protein